MRDYSKDKLTPEQTTAILELLETLVESDTQDQIVYHEIESPWEEDEGSSIIVMVARGEFRKLIEYRKSLIRDVVKTLRHAHEHGL